MLTTLRPPENAPWPAIIVLAITHRARRKASRLSGLSRQRFSALALLGRLSWERVDGFVMQASEKPAQERTSTDATSRPFSAAGTRSYMGRFLTGSLRVRSRYKPPFIHFRSEPRLP